MEGFFNAYKFTSHDNNKFILLLLFYEYMDDSEKYIKTLLPEKEDFYSHLNMEDVTDADYTPEKRVCKDFEIKSLGEYDDLYIQSDILLLADVFENFQNMCLEIYELDPGHFLTALGLAWQAAKDQSKIRSFN